MKSQIEKFIVFLKKKTTELTRQLKFPHNLNCCFMKPPHNLIHMNEEICLSI